MKLLTAIFGINEKSEAAKEKSVNTQIEKAKEVSKELMPVELKSIDDPDGIEQAFKRFKDAEIYRPQQVSKYPFTRSYSVKNAVALVKYVDDNLDEWMKKGDYAVYGKDKISLSRTVLVDYTNEDEFKISFFPNDGDHWLQLRRDSYSKQHRSDPNKVKSEWHYNNDYGHNDKRYSIDVDKHDTLEKKYQYLYDFFTNFEIIQTESWKRKKLFSKLGRVGWYKINDGEYYVHVEYNVRRFSKTVTHDKSIYRFEDWVGPSESTFTIDDLMNNFRYEYVEEDPHKTHWKHFAKLDFEKKAQHLCKVKDFVHSVLVKESEYKEMMDNYGEKLVSKIDNFSSFKVFCDIVHEKIEYDEHEITNALKLIDEEKSNEATSSTIRDVREQTEDTDNDDSSSPETVSAEI